MQRSRFSSIFPDAAPGSGPAINALERAYPHYRLRRLLGDVRSILNQLCYGPVWSGAPTTFEAWRATRVRPEPLAALARTGAAAGLPRLGKIAATGSQPWSEGVSLRDACRMLGDALRDCADAAERTIDAARMIHADAGMSLAQWRGEIQFPRKQVVEAFVEDTRAHPPAALRALLITGSSADGRIADGFSDLDAVAVIGTPPPEDDAGDALLATVDWLLRSNAHHLAFNPCNHHGPMLALEPSLRLCPEAALPSAIVRHGFWAYGEPPTVGDGGAGSRFEHVATFAGFESFFERAVTSAADVASAFHAVWWVSNLLFLPLALHQLRSGQSAWKRDCLDNVDGVLPADLADVIRRAGEVRLRVGRWIAERLPTGAEAQPWRGDANVMPGVALAAHKQTLAMTPGDRAAVGIDDALIEAGRRVWEHAAAAALDAHRAALTSAPAFVSWPREVTERPRPVDAGAYDRARFEMLTRAATEPAVVGVFEFGNVGCPGLSDLDFLVVLDDGCRGTPPVLLLDAFPGAAKAVIGHDALFVSRAVVHDLSAVFPIFGARRLYGRGIDLPPTTSLPDDVRAALYTWSTATKYPNDLIWLAKEPRTRWATILAYANSFGHVRRCLADMGIAIPASVERCVALNDEIRQAFLTGGVATTADLHAATDAALRASAGAIAALERHWRPRLGLESLPPADEDSLAAEVEASRASDPNWFPLLPPALRAIRGYCAEQTESPGAPRCELEERLARHLGAYLEIRRRVVRIESAADRAVSRYVHEPLVDGGPPWRDAVKL